jgi:hypothetical protein
MLGFLVFYTLDSELIKVNANEEYFDLVLTKQATLL